MDIRLNTKIYLENDSGKFMGIGVLWLLKEMRKGLSLRSAAAELGISYSKAYNMVGNLEASLSRKILVRYRGGQDRNGAVLTEFAVKFIMLYDSFQKQCKSLLTEPFSEFTERLGRLLTEG